MTNQAYTSEPLLSSDTYTFIPIVDVQRSFFPFPPCMGWHYGVNRLITIRPDIVSQADEI